MATRGNARFYWQEPKGMGGDSPWDLVVNARPTARGLVPFSKTEPWVSAGGAVQATVHVADWVNLDGKWRFVFVGSQGATPATRQGGIAVVSESGFTELGVTLSVSAGGVFNGVAGEEWNPYERFGWAQLFDKLFFSRGTQMWVLSAGVLQDGYNRTSPWYGASGTPSADNGWKVDCVKWRQGSAAGSLPYVEGSFGAPILCSHLNRLFMAGFQDGHVIAFDQTMTDSQRKLLELTNTVSVLSPTTIALSTRSLVWSDANDPFAISLPNFQSVLCRGPITGLCSWNGKLFVTSEQEIWVAEGMMTDETLTWRKVSDGIGVKSQHHIVATPYGVVLASATDVWLTDGNTVQRISDDIRHLWVETMSCGASVGIELQAIVPPFAPGRWGKLTFNDKTRELWLPVQPSTDQWVSRFGELCGCALVFNMDSKTWVMWTPPLNTAAPNTGKPLFPIWTCPHYNGCTYPLVDLVPTNTDTTAHYAYRIADAGICGTGSEGTAGLQAGWSLLVSKPLLVELGSNEHIVGVELAGAGIVGWAYLVSEEAQHGLDAGSNGEGDRALMAVGCPPYIPTADEFGTGLFGSAKYRNTVIASQYFDVTIRSKSCRLVVKLTREGTWTLHGAGIEYKSMGGGR